MQGKGGIECRLWDACSRFLYRLSESCLLRFYLRVGERIDSVLSVLHIFDMLFSFLSPRGYYTQCDRIYSNIRSHYSYKSKNNQVLFYNQCLKTLFLKEGKKYGKRETNY